jgi:hypothetical protein
MKTKEDAVGRLLPTGIFPGPAVLEDVSGAGQKPLHRGFSATWDTPVLCHFPPTPEPAASHEGLKGVPYPTTARTNRPFDKRCGQRKAGSV